jgi:sugar lactone lactonase YvrE
MSPVTLHAEPFADGFCFGEGPRWHDGRLWFTDGPAGVVRTVDETGRIEVAVESEKASGLGWLPDGTIVVCPLLDAAVTLLPPDGPPVHHDLSELAWSTNDMVVTAEGRIYVDLYNRSESGGIDGSLGLVAPDGEVRVVATDLATPNGLGVLPDGETLVVSETYGQRLVAFAIGDDGDLTDRRVFAELGAGRHPDGLCVDVEGGVWVGCYDTHEFLRVREGGEVTDRIETDGGWAVAPALGGTDGRDLFLVVNDTTHEKHGRGESSGRIERARVEVPGLDRQ